MAVPASWGHIWAPKAAQKSDCCWFLAPFLPTEKTSKKHPLPQRSLCAGGVDFDGFLVACWLSFSMPFRETPNPHILQQVSSESSVFTYQGLPSWHQKSIIVLSFSKVPFQTSFLFILCRFYANNCDLWIPFGTQRVPKCRPKSPRSPNGLQKL